VTTVEPSTAPADKRGRDGGAFSSFWYFAAVCLPLHSNRLSVGARALRGDRSCCMATARFSYWQPAGVG
jgi:hypothetical protein